MLNLLAWHITGSPLKQLGGNKKVEKWAKFMNTGTHWVIISFGRKAEGQRKGQKCDGVTYSG